MTGVTPDFVPVPASGVEDCSLDGERLLWQGGIIHHLDAVGSAVWECFDGIATVADVSLTLAAAFTANKDDVQRHVLTLCGDLLTVGLLEGGTPTALEEPPEGSTGPQPSKPFDPTEELQFTTGRLRALDLDFGIRTNDRRLAEHFNRSLRSFAAAGRPARWYSVIFDGPGEPYRVYLDGQGLFALPDADAVARYLLWHVNHQVMTGSSNHLLIHAAGATLGHQAVVLPAAMNAGKTTLVAGLVLDGLAFLTDEIVALNLSTGTVDPYPRAMNIGEGSWEILSVLRPEGRDVEDPLPRSLWHVDPASIRPDGVARSAPVRWIVEPRFEAGSATRLEPMSRSEAVRTLHRHAFNKHRFGNAGVRALVDAVRGARCARLINGDLGSAVAAVRRFLEEHE